MDLSQGAYPASIAEYAKTCSRPSVNVVDLDEQKMFGGLAQHYKTMTPSKVTPLTQSYIVAFRVLQIENE